MSSQSCGSRDHSGSSAELTSVLAGLKSYGYGRILSPSGTDLDNPAYLRNCELKPSVQSAMTETYERAVIVPLKSRRHKALWLRSRVRFLLHGVCPNERAVFCCLSSPGQVPSP